MIYVEGKFVVEMKLFVWSNDVIVQGYSLTYSSTSYFCVNQV